MKHSPLPSLNILESKFILDQDNWVLLHKKKCGVHEGQVAGNVMPAGYRRVKINKKLYMAHRVIYKMFYGVDPGDKEVDHIDGDKRNNNPENLRLATREQNRQNTGVYKNNSTGNKGVYFKSSNKGYYASVQCFGKRKEFGPFKTKEEAAEVYKREAKKKHKEFYRGE